jgi:hypothetical protein
VFHPNEFPAAAQAESGNGIARDISSDSAINATEIVETYDSSLAAPHPANGSELNQDHSGSMP